MSIRLLLLAGLLAVTTACSHPLEIVGHGDILSESLSRNCSYEDQPCSNVVTDAYSETYTARPRAGWVFSHWENYCLDGIEACQFDIAEDIVRKNWQKTMPPLVAHFRQVSSEGHVTIERGVLDADVSLASVADLNTTLCTSKSGGYGRVSFDIACFEGDGPYIVTASNGYEAWRFNDDSAQDMLGQMRAILPKRQVEQGWSINPLSETLVRILEQETPLHETASDPEQFWRTYISLSKLMVTRRYFGNYSPSINGSEMRWDLGSIVGSADTFGFSDRYYWNAAAAIRGGESISRLTPLQDILSNDIVDFIQPTVRAHFKSEGKGMQIDGNLLTVSTETGLNIYQISQDKELSLLSTVALEGIVFSAIHKNRLVIAQNMTLPSYYNSADQVHVLDISTPSTPVTLGTFGYDGSSNDGGIISAIVDEGRVFLASQSRLNNPPTAELIKLEAGMAGSFEEVNRIPIEHCGGCSATMQMNGGDLYLTQRLAVNDLGHLTSNIQTFNINGEDLERLGSLPNADRSRPGYLVFDGNYAWLKAWNPRLRRDEDTWLFYWPGSPSLQLLNISEPGELKEIALPAFPDLNILSRDIAVIDRTLYSLDAHAIRAYAYPEDNSGETDHPMVYLSPFDQTYYEMKLHGETAFLLGDGFIASKNLALSNLATQ